jgi:hypothetical protein
MTAYDGCNWAATMAVTMAATATTAYDCGCNWASTMAVMISATSDDGCVLYEGPAFSDRL